MKSFLQNLFFFFLTTQLCLAQLVQTNGLKDHQFPHHPLIGTKVSQEIPHGLSGFPTQNRMTASFINDEPSPAWVSHYINPTEPSHSQYNTIAFDRKGNVYAGGQSEEYPAGQVALLSKYDNKGVVQWVVREKSFFQIQQLAVDSSGDIYALGYPCLAKFDPNGVLQWLVDTCNAEVMALDSAGNVLVTHTNGYSTETVTIKYSPAGVPLWVVPLNVSAGSINSSFDIAVDRTGAVYVAAAWYMPGSFGEPITVKYSSEGIEEWGTSNGTGWGAYLAIDGAGAVYVSWREETASGGGYANHFTQKLDNYGVPRWVAKTSGYTRGIGLDDYGNVFVAVDGWKTVKYDSSGNERWISYLDHPSDDSGPGGFCVDQLGNAYLTSPAYLASPGRIVRLDGNGTVCWAHEYLNVGFGRPAVDASGKPYLVGALNDSSIGFTKALLLTMDTAGIESWRTAYEGPKLPIDIPADIGVDSAGNVYVCGTKPLVQGNSVGYFVLKYSSDGDLLWKRKGDTTSWNGDGQRPWMKVSPDGSAVVLHGLDDANQSSIALTSFDSEGLLQWSAVANAPGVTWWGQKKGLLSDPQGNIYAVSTSVGPWGSDSSTATYVRKFSKQGIPLWSSEASARYPISAALDRAGNLCVLTIASSWFHSETGAELPSVLRYDQSGHLDWTTQLDRPEESNLIVCAIAVDDSGAVIVIGRVYLSAQGRSYFLTVKLDSAGSHRWIKVYDEGSAFNEAPEEIVVDNEGDVVVAGNTTIVRYTKDGTQRWVTKRPSGGSRIVLKRAPDYDARQLMAAFPISPATITNMIADKDGKILVGYRGGGEGQDIPGTVEYSDSGTVSWAAFGVVPPYAIALDQHEHLCFTGGYGDIITVSYDLGAPLGIGSQASILREYEMHQNYPNPFNPSTTFRYSIPDASKVIIKVYDILGKEIETLVNEEKPTGTYEVQWNASQLSSGVYFYQLKAGQFLQTRKMVLLK